MIKLENVTLDFPALSYKTGDAGYPRSLPQATGGVVKVSRQGKFHVRALEEVSFVLDRGDRLALIGHNGAGKTTLLRVIAGIYPPTQGSVHTEGRVAALLSLTFGLDMEATGLDNIWVRGLFLGMSRAEIKKKIDAITMFSGLGDFLHLSMRTYSSGMRARLAFAISSHVDSDILLLDEVVATGDASFFDKARQQLDSITSQSKILVLASHSNKVLRELCTKGLLLEHGKVKAFGPLDEVIETYKSSLRPSAVAHWQTSLKEHTPPLVMSSAVVPKTIRILLMNDTGALPNPGCRAVRKAYKILFQNQIKGVAIAASVPVNYWKESFRSLAVPGKNSIHQGPGMFPAPAEQAAQIDLAEWERARRSLMENDQSLNMLLTTSDVVIVNGEGSIHHNSVRALALLALMKTALEAGRKVILLNATIQAMMPALLQEVLPKLSFIHVRETRSQAFLRQEGIDSMVTPDLAFLALDDASVPRVSLLDASAHILVTAGVAVSQESLDHLFLAVKNVGMRPAYLSIGDGGETELVTRLCSERNVSMIDAGKLGVKETIGFLRQFPLAISGRHHINIFLMRAGVPFLPLYSNTWKVEETLRMVAYPLQPVLSYADLEPGLHHVMQNLDSFGAAARQAYVSGSTAMDKLIERLAACIC